jgi:hypothetical protein
MKKVEAKQDVPQNYDQKGGGSISGVNQSDPFNRLSKTLTPNGKLDPRSVLLHGQKRDLTKDQRVSTSVTSQQTQSKAAPPPATTPVAPPSRSTSPVKSESEAAPPRDASPTEFEYVLVDGPIDFSQTPLAAKNNCYNFVHTSNVYNLLYDFIEKSKGNLPNSTIKELSKILESPGLNLNRRHSIGSPNDENREQNCRKIFYTLQDLNLLNAFCGHVNQRENTATPLTQWQENNDGQEILLSQLSLTKKTLDGFIELIKPLRTQDQIDGLEKFSKEIGNTLTLLDPKKEATPKRSMNCNTSITQAQNAILKFNKNLAEILKKNKLFDSYVKFVAPPNSESSKQSLPPPPNSESSKQSLPPPPNSESSKQSLPPLPPLPPSLPPSLPPLPPPPQSVLTPPVPPPPQIDEGKKIGEGGAENKSSEYTMETPWIKLEYSKMEYTVKKAFEEEKLAIFKLLNMLSPECKEVLDKIVIIDSNAKGTHDSGALLRIITVELEEIIKRSNNNSGVGTKALTGILMLPALKPKFQEILICLLIMDNNAQAKLKTMKDTPEYKLLNEIAKNDPNVTNGASVHNSITTGNDVLRTLIGQPGITYIMKNLAENSERVEYHEVEEYDSYRDKAVVMPRKTNPVVQENYNKIFDKNKVEEINNLIKSLNPRELAEQTKKETNSSVQAKLQNYYLKTRFVPGGTPNSFIPGNTQNFPPVHEKK